MLAKIHFLILLLNAAWISVNEADVLENSTSPIYCRYLLNTTLSSLTIDCAERTYGDWHRIYKNIYTDIDTILELYGNISLQSITINNSPITDIPRAICHGRADLVNLNLDRNWLQSLPMECLKNKRVLNKLSASYNNITRVETSLLKDLRELTELDISYNGIEAIDNKVFVGISTSKLWNISLASNKLKTFGVWPFYQSSRNKRLVVDARNNKIKAIQNDGVWHSPCNKSHAWLEFYLDGNELLHAADIFGAICRNLTDMYCIPYNTYWDLHAILPSRLSCDCLDFKFYSLIHFWDSDPIKSPIAKIECADKYQRAIMVKTDEMTCDVKEQCPSECQCINQPSNLTYHIICSGARLQNLPDVLPKLNFPKSIFMPVVLPKYKLYFSNGNLNTIKARSYFNSTNWIDLSNSNVSNITVGALESMRNIKTIILTNNNLTVLPEDIQNLNLTFEKLHLSGNPLRCNCEDSWLRNWIVSNPDRFYDSKNLICSSPEALKGKSILELKDGDICKVIQPLTIRLALVLSISVPILVVLGLVALQFRYRVQLFAKIKIHPFDRDECEGEDMDYDVFISFAHEDSEVARYLLSFLEEENSYKACFHQRDFISGPAIIENINTSICRSKRTLCLVSQSFIRSSYCMEEFQIALNRDVTLKTRRLIVLILDDVLSSLSSELIVRNKNDSAAHGEMESLLHAAANEEIVNLEQRRPEYDEPSDDELIDPGAEVLELTTLSEYLKRHTYITFSGDSWRSQLLYSLPITKLNCEAPDRGEMDHTNQMANVI